MVTDLPSQPQRVRRLLAWGARLVAAAAAVFAIVVGVRWLAAFQPKPQSDGQNSSLEAQWNSTIRRLGVNIEPVYPPQEDLSVGDLFATVVEDDWRPRRDT
jgi:Na+/H+-dicarboxylate symporter